MNANTNTSRLKIKEFATICDIKMALIGRNAVIFGVANQWSLAWAVAKKWHQSGANLALVCASDRIAGSVKGLVERQHVELNNECVHRERTRRIVGAVIARTPF